jgi:hypothetical protein
VKASYSAWNDCRPNGLQHNPREALSKTPRESFENLSVRRFVSAARTEMLSKIQLIKFNLMVSADCEPT